MAKRTIKRVAVLGSGVMGSRIALHFAGIGVQVILLDIVPKEAEGSNNKATRNKLVNDDLQSAIKQKVFAQFDQFRKPRTLITSNTSCIPIHLMAEGLSEDFNNHFCGTHFF